ncbi:MAG: peptidoglycan recognition protein [Acidimicrobiia bacterium]|nr:peptidoglycan recognition protein [Acidimicrobiia bacterium]
MRVRSNGKWGEWQTLEPEEGPDHSSPEFHPHPNISEPIWTGSSDAYQVELPAGASGLQAHLVRESGKRLQLSSVVARASAAPQPAINPRSSWGARPPKVNPSYGSTVQMAFIHHTVNSNTYAPGDVPGILRSIQAYHMDSNGWDDIGYNFLVDRFGGVWEGRAGGVDRPVVGAHTLGFNTNSTGIAVIGDFTSAQAPPVAIDSAAQLIGWKLGLSGVDPAGTTVMTSGDSGSRWPQGTPVRLNDVSGHRDANYTDCPGDGLYGQLPGLRNLARSYWAPILAYPPGFRGGVFTAAGALTGDGRTEVVTGADSGGGPQVRVFTPQGAALSTFFAYAPQFGGGVRVATARFVGTTVDQIITGAGPGGGPQVRTFNMNGQPNTSFYAYGSGFPGGVYVAGGNVDGLPGDEIITGAGSGGGPHVRIFRQDGTAIGGFFAYPNGFTGGVRVTAGDLNGDGKDEIITAPGPSGGPQIRIFRLDGTPIGGFWAYGQGFTGGVYVDTVRAPDGKSDWIVTGAGEGGGTQVRFFTMDGTPMGGFFLDGSTSGVRVGGGSFDGTNPGQVAVAEGPGTIPGVWFGRSNGQMFRP